MFELYVTERALRFTDSGEQNMKVIQRNQIVSLTVQDTDFSFTTLDRPKVLGITAFCAALGGGGARWLASEKLGEKRFFLDSATAIGGAAGFWMGLRFGVWAFTEHRIAGTSRVEVATPQGTESFSCSDAKARELVRLFS